MNSISFFLVGALLVVQAEPQDSGGEANVPILIDWIHANDFSMIGLRPGIYDYHTTVGFGSALITSRLAASNGTT